MGLPLSKSIDALRSRCLDIGDLIIFLYIAAFVRQYLWLVGDNRLAWPLTLLLSALVWGLHWRTKEPAGDATPAMFWPSVALPLFGFYALRAALPDLSWDVIDYRLINAERALSGWPIRPGDFFPTRFPFNPAPDMVMGLGRYLLGYRLGTLVNFSVLVWTGMLLERLLRAFVRGATARCLSVLVLLLTEQLLFEVNNYMVDLLALPLLLEAARISIETEGGERGRRDFLRAGLYLGASLAFKLTNLAYAVPIVLLFAYRVLRKDARFDLKAVLYGLAAILLPLAPYSLYIFRQTGNPVFPLYNWIFQSPYWPVIDTRTERWGPIVDDPRFKHLKAWEILLWPLLQPFRVEHTAADLGPHWGRVSVAFVAALCGVLWRGADRRIRSLSFITLFGAILWSAASGMLRYAMFVELAGGAVTIYFIVVLYRRTKDSTPPRAPTLARVAALLLSFVLVAQSAATCVYAYRFEWGSRPVVFALPGNHLHDARHLLSDRSARGYLSTEERALFDGVGAWMESGPMTSGIQVLFNAEAPQLCVYMPEFFSTEESRRRFARALELSRGKRLATLCMADEFKSCTEHLSRAGLGVGKISAVSLPYYSERARFATSYFMEVLPPGVHPRREFEITAAAAPLADGDFRAALSWARTPPLKLSSGERRALSVVVRNASRVKWPSLGQAGQNLRLFLGNHWLAPDGRILTNDDGRSSLPYDLAPGEEIELLLTVTAPREPGDYFLEVDLLQEGVSWFGLKGSDTLRLKVKVEEQAPR
jgi:hypothetical protein